MSDITPAHHVTEGGIHPGELAHCAHARCEPARTAMRQDCDRQRKSILFNDVTRAPWKHHVFFSDRRAIAEYLWEQGWRRDVRPEDVNTVRRPS